MTTSCLCLPTWRRSRLSRNVLAGHPKGEGDEEGGQDGAGGQSQTHHGQEAQQCRQEEAPPVPDQRLQPLTKLEEGKNISTTASSSWDKQQDRCLLVPGFSQYGPPLR